MIKKSLHYWNKYNRLSILKKNWFNIPNFVIYNEKKKIKLRYPLIFRSSFSIEDSKKYSFAWIFDSYFPIFDNNALQSAIDKSKLYYESDKFMNYVIYNKISQSDIIYNYMLQEFIVWDLSWVIFSSYDKKYIRIEFIPWLNYPFTDGYITSPNIYLFNKDDFNDFIINDVYTENFCLSILNWKISKIDTVVEYEIKFISLKDKLLKIVIDIEKLFWCPQNIEFTIKNDDIYILQSRDIINKDE